MGTHQNRLDAKGRVSIPAPFRTVLRNGSEGAVSFVLRPSHQHACIEGWPQAVFESLAKPLENLDLFSEAHDDFAAALYAEAFFVESDKEGRIVLPESLVTHAALTDTAAFIGVGRSFQIWEPDAGAARLRAARENTRSRSLPSAPRAAQGSAA